jgi:MFS family permease
MPLTSPSTADRRSTGFSAIAPFFLSSFAWNFALGMTYILVPLYARSLGMGGVQIGTLVALPVLSQVAFTLLGGGLTDRVGGKNMAMASCILMCVGSSIFMLSSGFAMMIVAQITLMTARGIFWPATWALASELPNAGIQMGRLNGATNAGQIAGTATAGFIIAVAGYRVGFGAMAAVCFAALVFNQLYRSSPRASRGSPMLATYRVLLGKRSIHYGMLCAYISALPLSLSFSFYPILLVEQGLDSDTTGSLISLRAVGGVIAGFVVGYYIKNVRGLRMPLFAATVVGVSVPLAAAVSQIGLIAGFLFMVGVGSAVMTLYFQMLMSVISTKEMRGSAMALGGLGWSISHLSTPLVMGVLQEWISLQTSFYVMGGFTLLCGVALVPFQRWALASESLTADPGR